MARLHNPRRAKIYRSYTVTEITELYGCHKNTVRNWLRDGLETLDGQRNTMVHGTVLNAFHAARRDKSKRPCTPGEMLCCGCGRQRRPALNLLEYVPIGPTLWAVTAICPVCEGIMNQRVGKERLDAFRQLGRKASTKA